MPELGFNGAAAIPATQCRFADTDAGIGQFPGL